MELDDGHPTTQPLKKGLDHPVNARGRDRCIVARRDVDAAELARTREAVS
jgi:hypothetical protein